MIISKHVVTTTLAAVGLFVFSTALSLPGFSELAPRSTIDICVAKIAEQANYEDAGRVRHEVVSKPRRSSGHILKIDTIVYGFDGEQVIREYATTCAVSGRSVTKLFEIREKGSRE